jgi:TPR repeat protein
MERPIAQNEASPENQEPIAEANTEDSPETTSRGLQPADASSDANTRKAAPADNNTVADNSTVDNNTTASTETDPQTAQRTADPVTSIGDAGTSKASSGSFLGETGVPVSATQTRGGASARIAGGTVGIASTLEAQQKALEDGKSLFRKSSKSKSAYEAKRAAEYLAQAGPAADGEAFYMLAVLHHQGLGLEQDVEKALEYAELSKKNEYTGGYFLYGVYLLERKNSIDSTNAINAIKIAAQRGHEGAKAKLQELGI